MTVTEPGPLPGGPLSDEWGTEALRTRVAKLLERARARTRVLTEAATRPTSSPSTPR